MYLALVKPQSRAPDRAGNAAVSRPATIATSEKRVLS